MSKRQAQPATTRLLASATLAVFALAGFAGAQTTPAPASTPPGAASAKPAQGEKTFSQEQLDQILAPIALYPDGLLAQVLMASTYPIEIVTAERWVKSNPGLKDKALEDALQKQPWDASVKSMAAFPQVLTMMSEKLDWTQQLGDAFLAQPKDVSATVQNLRAKASKEGNLKDTKEQKIVTEQVATQTIIKIEPANPQVVYVPTYNPTVVYGSWWYPSYPPYYYYPPGYAVAGAAWGFAAGVAAGAIWGNYNWGGGNVDIDVNRYNNFNKTNISNKNWNHDASHRGAVPYKDKGVAQQHGRGQSPSASTRDASRGRDGGAQASTRDAGRGASAGSMDRGASAGSMDRGAGGASASQRGSVSASPRDSYGGGGGSAASRDMSGTRNSSAFNTGSGAQTRDASSRGNSSMSSSRASSSGASRSSAGGASRGGGGGGRGGGGRR